MRCYWYTVYVIRNDRGLYYIGKHKCWKSEVEDPWNAHDYYFGSGKKLRRAQNVINTGWNWRETIAVLDTADEMTALETLLIREAKDDLNCLNHHWDPLRWVNLAQE